MKHLLLALTFFPTIAVASPGASKPTKPLITSCPKGAVKTVRLTSTLRIEKCKLRLKSGREIPHGEMVVVRRDAPDTPILSADYWRGKRYGKWFRINPDLSTTTVNYQYDMKHGLYRHREAGCSSDSSTTEGHYRYGKKHGVWTVYGYNSSGKQVVYSTCHYSRGKLLRCSGKALRAMSLTRRRP